MVIRNRYRFFVRGEKAVLIDFDTTRKYDDRNTLVEDLDGLPGRLQNLSNRGGGGIA